MGAGQVSGLAPRLDPGFCFLLGGWLRPPEPCSWLVLLPGDSVLGKVWTVNTGTAQLGHTVGNI